MTTEDEQHFGHDVWVYCTAHLRPHKTGWCTVSARDKIKLEATTPEAAEQECVDRGFHLYKPG